MTTRAFTADAMMATATPHTHQQGHESQPFGHLIHMPIALSETVCKVLVEHLNQRLADTITPRDLYTMHHWHQPRYGPRRRRDVEHPASAERP